MLSIVLCWDYQSECNPCRPRGTLLPFALSLGAALVGGTNEKDAATGFVLSKSRFTALTSEYA